VPVGILFYRQSLREEDNTLDLELGEGPKDLTPATPEEISSFVSMVKNESSMSVSTADSIQGSYDDLCPICLDEHDLGDSLCTLQCGHVFHERCMDCLVGRAYEQARSQESSECVDKLLGSIKCPLCRQPVVQCEESAPATSVC